MAQIFFDSIVHIFNIVCAATGATYALLNILVYCLFVPWTWCALFCIRRRRVAWLAAASALALAAGAALVFSPPAMIQEFYDRQVHFLLFLALNDSHGYVLLSLTIGVAVPILVYGLLLSSPLRMLPGLYAFVNLSLAVLLLAGWTSAAESHTGTTRTLCARGENA